MLNGGDADGNGICENNEAVDCAGSWSDYGSCSEDCGGGTQVSTYTVTTAAVGTGAACEAADGDTQTQACNEDLCPVDCVGSWSDWDLVAQEILVMMVQKKEHTQ